MAIDAHGEGERMGWWQWMRTCGGRSSEVDRRNLRRFNVWVLAWAASFVVVTVLLVVELIANEVVAWAAALVPSVFGVLAVLAFVRFLRDTDELWRKIQLEALALGFGAGYVFMLGYPLFERLGAPELDVSDAGLVMLVFWIVGLATGMRRYR